MPKNINVKSKRGFTIIEVVLVLAVAGLIFLMVFIALPALQRSQRDTQRHNDYGMLSSAITNYSASNGGKLFRLAGAKSKGQAECLHLNPATYINAEGEDPNGYQYQLVACTWDGWEAIKDTKLSDKGEIKFNGSDAKKPWLNAEDADEDAGVVAEDVMGSQVYVIVGADCNGFEDGHNVPEENPSSRAFAIYGYQETGSQTYCSASQ